MLTMINGAVKWELRWVLSRIKRKRIKINFMNDKGLVMTGYHGWFICEGDGVNRG